MLAREPDLVFLANGPGDPAALDYVVDTVRELVGKKPVVGICLGHQLLCRAVGLETFKLPFGHRGANHPVKDLETGKIDITSQNHGFAVRPPDGGETIETDEPVRWETDFGAAELTHLNLYDRTVEGLALRDVPGCTVQYHPEAGPGPARRALPLRPLPGAGARDLAAASERARRARSSGSSRSAASTATACASRRATPRSGPGSTAGSRRGRRLRPLVRRPGSRRRARRRVVLRDDLARDRRADRQLLVPDVRPEHDGLEIGWTWLHPSAWRTGANVEAKLLMLGHAFDELGCMRVEFKTDARNERSRAALEALGASFEGIFRKHMLMPLTGVRDSAYYSITDDEWPELRERLAARLERGGGGGACLGATTSRRSC